MKLNGVVQWDPPFSCCWRRNKANSAPTRGLFGGILAVSAAAISWSDASCDAERREIRCCNSWFSKVSPSFDCSWSNDGFRRGISGITFNGELKAGTATEFWRSSSSICCCIHASRILLLGDCIWGTEICGWSSSPEFCVSRLSTCLKSLAFVSFSFFLTPLIFLRSSGWPRLKTSWR